MIKVHTVSEKDAEDIQKLYFLSFMDTYPDDSHGIMQEDVRALFGDYLSEAEIDKRKKQITNLSSNEYFFVAKEKELVVGLCRLVKNKDFCQLKSIYVLPEYQRRGIGTMLWGRIKDFVDKKTIVHVAVYNKKAISFYTKIGFEDSGKRFYEERHKMPISGKYIPEMEMILN